jgi:oligopeptidase B
MREHWHDSEPDGLDELSVTSLNDTWAPNHEPAKWIARVQQGRRAAVPAEDRDDGGRSGRSGRNDAWREEAIVLGWIITTAGGTG